MTYAMWWECEYEYQWRMKFPEYFFIRLNDTRYIDKFFPNKTLWIITAI